MLCPSAIAGFESVRRFGDAETWKASLEVLNRCCNQMYAMAVRGTCTCRHLYLWCDAATGFAVSEGPEQQHVDYICIQIVYSSIYNTHRGKATQLRSMEGKSFSWGGSLVSWCYSKGVGHAHLREERNTRAVAAVLRYTLEKLRPTQARRFAGKITE